MTVYDTADERVLHDEAVRHLNKRRDFYTHLVVYFLVNGFLVVIWAFTTMPGFFWPVFPIFGWGIGVVMNAWDVFGRSEIREEDIRREMERMSRHEQRPRPAHWTSTGYQATQDCRPGRANGR